jgi:hypothetical protein
MSIRNWTDYNARRTTPGYQPAYVPNPADTVSMPAMMVSEGDDALEAIRRYVIRTLGGTPPWLRNVGVDRDVQGN